MSWTPRIEQQAAAMKSSAQVADFRMPPRYRGLMERLAHKHGIRPRDIPSHSNFKPCVDARKEAAQQMRQWGLSLPHIGKLLGGRHHSTVLWYLRGEKAPPPTLEERITALEAEVHCLLHELHKLKRDAIAAIAPRPSESQPAPSTPDRSTPDASATADLAD